MMFEDPPDLLIEADVGIMQMFAGEINLNIEPRTQQIRFIRKQVHTFTNLVISFDIPDVSGQSVKIDFPVNYFCKMNHTLRSSVFEVPCTLILHINEFGLEELHRQIPQSLSSWEHHYKEKNSSFPGFFMLVIDPLEMSWTENHNVLFRVPFSSMHNYFLKMMRKQWKKHLEEQIKLEDVDIDEFIVPIENTKFARFYEKLCLKNIESSFVVAKKKVRIFTIVKREPRVSRRAIRKKAALAAAATRALRRKQRQEEEEEEDEEEEENHDAEEQVQEEEEEEDEEEEKEKNKEKEDDEEGEKEEGKKEEDVDNLSNEVVSQLDNAEKYTEKTLDHPGIQIERTSVKDSKEKKKNESGEADEKQKMHAGKIIEEINDEDISQISNSSSEGIERHCSEMSIKDTAVEANKPVSKGVKKRKKPKKIAAPRKKRTRRSPSYDVEEEEILLIESEFKRQIGVNSDSDASEEIGES